MRKSRNPATTQALDESLAMTEAAEEQFDECPECGEGYIDTDTTLAGSLVFVHDEEPLDYCKADPDEVQLEDDDAA